MKYFTLCLLVLSLSQGKTNAFISNIISGAVGHVNNTINTVTNAADLASLGGQFLWDNSLKPTLDVLQNNGLNFIDNHFGGILNIIGKRETLGLENKEINFVRMKYMVISNGLIQDTKEIFHQFFTQIMEQIAGQFESLLTGETTIKKIVAGLMKKMKIAVGQLFQVAAENFTDSLTDSNLSSLKEFINTLKEVAIETKFIFGKMESFINTAIEIMPQLLTKGN